MNLTQAPASVRWFALLWAAQALLTVVFQLVHPGSVIGGFAALPDASGLDLPIVQAGIAARLGLAALAWWLVLWRKSSFGRWMATLLAVLRLRDVIPAVVLVTEGQLLPALWLMATLAGLAAAIMLFRPATRNWLLGHAAPLG